MLSIDTLKTCVVLDAMTGHRTDANRELMAQGTGNLLSAIFGGTPGAGTMGPTLLNLNSGGQTRRAGMISGSLILAAFLFGRPLIALIPTAALAGILIVLGSRMVDRESFQLLRHRATILDFTVVLVVVVVALVYDLITAAGVGIALALALFMRNMINGSVIRRKLYGDQISSSRQRHAGEKAILIRQGRQAVLCELQGSLFFGTRDQLLTELDADIRNCRFILLDLQRVQAFDFTAGHVLHVICKQVQSHQGYLLLCSLPASLPTGCSLADYLKQIGILRSGPHLQIFDSHDEAIEWVENQILAEATLGSAPNPILLSLDQVSLFSSIKSQEVLNKAKGFEKIPPAWFRFFTRSRPVWSQSWFGDF